MSGRKATPHRAHMASETVRDGIHAFLAIGNAMTRDGSRRRFPSTALMRLEHWGQFASLDILKIDTGETWSGEGMGGSAAT
jgi:hypothetical protein